ncbi:MAG: hypothetical protein LUH56_07875 [Oscillospiraceae bacterium]|nr:hypothetical protein [Oscillospiraceae bacterium]
MKETPERELSPQESSDYTEWQKKKFDGVSSEDFNAAAVAYAKENPLRANS